MNDNPLFSPVYLKDILLKEGIFARRSRGQNFLIDRNVADKILRAADLSDADTVLEIGPGPGALTLELCRLAGKVVTVEWDRGLVRILREQANEYDNLEIIQADFLKTDLPALADNLRNEKTLRTGLKVVANLPYSITGPLLVKLLESEIGFSILVLMVQKEVGERIVSPPGNKKYGRLSVLCRTYSEVEIISQVSRNSFFPRPGVDSVILRFKIYPAGKSSIVDPARWKNLVRAAFAQRRKMLKNTLAADRQLGYSEDQIIAACHRVEIDPRGRAEQLSVKNFIQLANALGER
ncbi:MAG TPA: ribosomal RNA small subunit methyltransferase A, partial [Proteobacteria bacterium]|nr:ribosomal RNA small subunit methyltransferase A [Pseudomonadota bacterium]